MAWMKGTWGLTVALGFCLFCVTLCKPLEINGQTQRIGASLADFSSSERAAYKDRLPVEADPSDPFLVLVNPSHAVAKGADFDLVDTPWGTKINREAYHALQSWLDQAKKAGYQFEVISAYRSPDNQAVNRQLAYDRYISQGYTNQQARAWVNSFYAPSQASEHSTGLAVDLLDQEWLAQGGNLVPDYGNTLAGQWLASHAAEFGFILRYPKDKIAITSYAYEPWHFRYVGKIHAEFMMREELTLEEYRVLLEDRQAQVDLDRLKENFTRQKEGLKNPH